MFYAYNLRMKKHVTSRMICQMCGGPFLQSMVSHCASSFRSRIILFGVMGFVTRDVGYCCVVQNWGPQHVLAVIARREQQEKHPSHCLL